jgi:hypothetical protein
MYNWYLSLIQSFQYIHGTSYNIQLYMAHSPCLISPCQFPFLPLCVPFYLLGTLLAVTGIVHLSPRLLVN